MRHKDRRNRRPLPKYFVIELVCGKFRAVVSGYGLDVFLVGQQQTSDRFGQRLGLLPMASLVMKSMFVERSTIVSMSWL